MQKMFIGGKWREAASGETLPVVDPSTGEAYDTIPRGSAADIDAGGQGRARGLRGRVGRADGDRARPDADARCRR